MKRTAITAFVLALTFGSPAFAQLVERVIDGDTVTIAGVGSVRLIGVDTPETVDPRKPVQRFGQEASTFLRALVHNKMVRLEYGQQRIDQHRRTLAYLYLPDGTFVNAEIVKQGYGHAYTAFPFRHMEEFRGYERAARAGNRGLWATGPVLGVLASPPPNDTQATVYVTRTGAKYHAAGCRFLARSQIPMPLGEAAARYGPCSVCNPPALNPTTAPVPTVSVPRTPAPPRSVTSSTKRGTQCSRNAQTGRSYCWQH
jgi:micrococcal nuclease